MSFQNVKNQFELDALIEEFAKTQSELKKKSEAEASGEIEQSSFITKFQEPITSLLGTKTTQLDPTTGQDIVVIETFKTVIDNIASTLINSGLSQNVTNSILTVIQKDTKTSKKLLKNLKRSLIENGATEQEMLSFLKVIAIKNGTPELKKDVLENIEEEIVEKYSKTINDLQNKVLDLEAILRNDNLEESEINNINKKIKVKEAEIGEFMELRDTALDNFEDIFNSDVDVLSDDSDINVLIKNITNTVSQQTITTLDDLNKRKKTKKIKSTGDETKKIINEEPKKIGTTFEPTIPSSSSPFLNKTLLDFEEANPSQSVYKIFDKEKDGKTPFKKYARITDNKFIIVEKTNERQPDDRATFRDKPGTDFIINKNLKNLLLSSKSKQINTPKGLKTVNFKDNMKRLSVPERLNMIEIYQSVNWSSVLEIDGRSSLSKKYEWLAGGDKSISGEGYKKLSNMFPTINIGSGFDIFTGENLYPTKKNGRGFKPRNPYKIDEGFFGDLKINVSQLKNFLRLIVEKNGKVVADQIVDKDTFDLLTKRFNKKKKYSENSISIFRDLVELGNLPLKPTSTKFSLLSKKQRKGIEGINKNQKGGDIQMFQNDNDLISKLGLNISSIKAGNNSQIMKSQTNEIIDLLMSKDIISKEEHKIIFEQYLI
jgi:hypothetical protein